MVLYSLYRQYDWLLFDVYVTLERDSCVDLNEAQKCGVSFL